MNPNPYTDLSADEAQAEIDALQQELDKIHANMRQPGGFNPSRLAHYEILAEQIEDLQLVIMRATREQALTRTAGQYNDGGDVGDILYSTWGYDQTNVDFYLVMRRTEKSIWLQPIGALKAATDFLSGKTVPDTNVIKGEVLQRRIRHSIDGRAGAKINEFAYAYAWQGDPLFYSEWA